MLDEKMGFAKSDSKGRRLSSGVRGRAGTAGERRLMGVGPQTGWTCRNGQGWQGTSPRGSWPGRLLMPGLGRWDLDLISAFSRRVLGVPSTEKITEACKQEGRIRECENCSWKRKTECQYPAESEEARGRDLINPCPALRKGTPLVSESIQDRHPQDCDKPR